MKSRLFKLLAVLMLVSLLVAPISGMSVKASSQGAAVAAGKYSLEESETGMYIVRLQDASLAAYRGGVAGLRATSPEVTGARQLDDSTADSQAYLNYLDARQGELLRNMQNAYGHPVEAVFEYQHVLNAVAVRISHAEALRAFNLPGVIAVYPDVIRHLDTDVGPTWIGAPSIWEGETLDGSLSYGEGVIIGVLDSGINHAHPSFADVGADGYNHVNPLGTGIYLGWCVANPSFCNDKLIGAYDFSGETNGPEDGNGHGSHTASTAGGNFVNAELDDGVGGTFTMEISGVAPHANIIAYQVLMDSGSGSNVGIVAGANQAVADGVDVINYSISGSDDPWADPVDLAFLDAYTAGVFVSASAGNDGPADTTVAKTGPWNAAVAASTHNRIVAHPIDAWTDTAERLDMGALEGNGTPLAADLTDNILWSGDVDPANVEGCTAWDAGAFAGVIGLVSRGTCAFEIKINNLMDAGAVAAIIYNNRTGSPIYMDVATATDIPAFMIGQVDGLALAAMIDGDASAMATIPTAQNVAYDDTWGDIIGDFSSRGPTQWELLKPDYAAPGVNILAAVAAVTGDPVQYDFYQGTSMASPHGAGAAALLLAIHPEWSPSAIKSAIATTANQNMLEENTLETAMIVSPAEPFDMGSGRIDLNAAAFAGFVLNETSDNYIAANPYLGGDPKSLNQPSMVNYYCFGTCTWERTITSTLDVAQEWQIDYVDMPGLTLSATPETFTLAAGGTQTITITADVTAATPDVYYFGDIVLTPVGNDTVADGHLTVVARLGLSNLPNHMDIVTDQLAGTETLTDLMAFYPITDLYTEVFGLTEGTVTNISLNQDTTNGDPFDVLSQVYYTTVRVRGALRFVVEIGASEAPDVDLYVGTGRTPSADTIVAYSAGGSWNEYVNIDFPVDGTYWVLVQNWQGTTAQPDAIQMVHAVVTEDASNLTVTGLDTVPAMTPYDLDVNWDEPTMVAGDHWYAQFNVATDPASAGNLGYTDVDLDFIEASYGVDLSPATLDGYGDPGTVVAHTLTVTNLGNVADTFNLSYSGNIWTVALPVTSVALAAGASTDITVNVTVPVSAAADDWDDVEVKATSAADPAATDTSVVTTYASPFYGVSIAPLTDAADGLPGTDVTYTLTLTNEGNTADTFTLSFADNLWTVDLPVTSIPLAASASDDFLVTVTVPADALAGDSDSATIIATSTGDGTQTAEAVVTTTALAVYDIDLSPATDGMSGNPGDVVTYTLSLENLGNLADTVTVAASGNVWGVNLPTTSFNLAVGGTNLVTVEVTIPGTATEGEFDMVTITATSTGGEEVVAELTTTATVVVPNNFYLLPIMLKN